MPSCVQIFALTLALLLLQSAIAQKPRARRVSVGKSSALVLHLPIRVRTPNHNNVNDNQPQPTENESLRQSGYFPFQGQQRLVMRTYDPEDSEDGEDDERERSSDEDNESTEGRNSDNEEQERHPNVGFLRWNGGNRGMMLNIKDYFDLGAGGPASTVSSEEEDEEEEERKTEEPEEWLEQEPKKLQHSSVNYLPPSSSSSLTARYPGRNRHRSIRPGNFFQDPGPFRYVEEEEEDEDDMPPSEFSSPRSRRPGYEQGSGNFEGLSGGVYGSHPIENMFKQSSISAKNQRRKGYTHNRRPPNPYRQFSGF